MTKYCTSISGEVDGKAELDPEDDAAYVNWGPHWRIPTYDQIYELVFQCNWSDWTTLNGVNGRWAVGPNGNSIFMPAPGQRSHEEFELVGSWACYWSRSVYESSPDMAYNLYFHSNVVFRGSTSRFIGYPVRPVYVPQD
jgi:hypothetical protein